jgi:hypothetical protein
VLDRSFRFSSVFAFLISLVIDGCHVLRRKENREGIEKKVTCPSFSVLSSEGVARVLHGERLTFPKAHLRLPTALGLAPLFSCVCVFCCPCCMSFFFIINEEREKRGRGAVEGNAHDSRTYNHLYLPSPPLPLVLFSEKEECDNNENKKGMFCFFFVFCFILIY